MATTNNPLLPVTEKEKATWVSHVLIPVAQNVIGGAGLIGLCAIGAVVATGELTDRARIICELIGTAFTCLITITRFFGDDLGILTAAYKAGAASRDTEVNALEHELQEAHRLIDQLNGVKISSGARDELIDRCQRSREHALELVRRKLANEEYGRKQLNDKRVMKQHDWNRAYALLCQARVVDRDTKKMSVRTVSEAQRAIDPVYKNGLEIAKNGGRPAWLVA